MILCFCTASSLFAQNHEKELIQFSGVVVDAVEMQPLPFSSVMIKNSFRGTVCDYYGFFSFVAQKNDTIEFSSMGYRRAHYVIPDTLSENKYSLIQLLYSDTILLREAVVYPWPTKEQFRQAFINLHLPEDDMTRAKRNLDQEELRERYETMAMDGSMNFRHQMQEHQNRLYYLGQYPPNQLLNPLAWIAFIQAWKEGKFSRQKQ